MPMRVNAEAVGKRIYVRVPYSEENVEKCKSVSGARWSKKAKAWTYPKDLEVARMLREIWGDALVLGPELTKWGKAETKRERRMVKYVDVKDLDVMAQVHLPRVSRLAPTMWAAMNNRPYQTVAAKYMAIGRTVLCGDQPGLGKTIESLGAIVESMDHGRILVLAPRKSCRVVWQPEIHKWMSDYEHGAWTYLLAGLSPQRVREACDEFMEVSSEEPGLHFMIANAEMARIKKATKCPNDVCDGDEDWCPESDRHVNKSEVRVPFLHDTKWDAIIADETHKWLINTRGNNASQVGYGFTKLHTVENGLRIALTGTPLKGKKHNLFGTLNWLRPKVHTSKWRWIEQYFHVYEDPDGYGRIIGSMIEDRKESFFRALSGMMIRRTKHELHAINPSWMPPDKVYHDVYIPMEGKQGTLYRKMQNDARAELTGGTLEAIGVLPELTRLKQFAQSNWYMDGRTLRPCMPSNKFEWLLDFLEERGIEQGGDLSEDVNKVVVASQFTKLLNMYADELTRRGIACYVITGETKDRDAEEYAHRFQSDGDVRVVLINTAAGGVSITLDAADDMIVNDETWVPDEQEQVEDRAHRTSRTDHQVNVWYPRSDESIESEIAADNMDKAESNHVVLDATRGMRFAYERMHAIIKERDK